MDLDKLFKQKIERVLNYKQDKFEHIVYKKEGVLRKEPSIYWVNDITDIEGLIKRKIGNVDFDFPRKEDFKDIKRIKYTKNYHKSDRQYINKIFDKRSEEIVNRNLKIVKEEKKLTKEEHEYLIECLEDLDKLSGEIEVELDIREEELKDIIIVGKEETRKSTFLNQEIEGTRGSIPEINWANSNCCLLNEFLSQTIFRSHSYISDQTSFGICRHNY
jgi:hypothetical protein